MGLRAMMGRADEGDSTRVVLFCSTSGIALPFMFDDFDESDAFTEWVASEHLIRDLRKLSYGHQLDLLDTWRRTACEKWRASLAQERA